MITVFRGSPLGLLFYWKKPVTDRPGRSRQNDHFIVVNGTQDWFSPSLQADESEPRVENSRMNTGLHTPGIIQIPIALRHTEISHLRPAVSSLGACPTPVR
jgi:hypothetical protein